MTVAVAWWTIPIAGIILAVGVTGWLNRRTLKPYFERPVVLTRGHTALYTGLVGLAIASTIITSAVNRKELGKERDARLKTVTAQLVTMDRLDRAERDLKRYARLLAPSEQDVLEVVRRYRRICARSAACRRDFAASINQVLRVENSRIVPAPQDARPAPAPQSNGGASPFPRPAPPPEIITVPGPQGKPGPQGPRGEPGRNVDSALVDGLENRIADVEKGLRALLGRIPGIERVLALLCRTPLRICG
jgi:hypothetical protein